MVSEFEKQFPKPTGNKYDHEYRLRRDEWLDRKEGWLKAFKWFSERIYEDTYLEDVEKEIEELEKL